MIFALIMRQRKRESAKSLLVFMIGCSLSWGVGYVGMWMGKWIIAAFVMGIDEFAGVFATIQSRSLSGAVEEGISFKETIQSNLRFLEKPIYKFIPVMLLLYHAIQISVKRIKPIELAKRGLPFVFVIMLPFFWYIVTTEHANVHSWFTYRTLCVAILGFFSMLTSLSEKRQY